jgi:hypothetical protein
MTVRLVAGLVFLLAVTRVQAQQHEHKMPPAIVELGGKEVAVPLSFVGGRPVVEVKISGKGPYRFFFDTGASGPVISKKGADELGLRPEGEAMVKSGGDGPNAKPIIANRVTIGELELGMARLREVMIVAMDRTRLGGDTAPVGVLSPNQLQHHLVTIDYPKKELRIRAGELPQADEKSIFSYLKGKPIPSLMVEVAGEKIEAHLDSGSGAGLSLPMKFGKSLPLEGELVDTKRKAARSVVTFRCGRGSSRGSLPSGSSGTSNLRFNSAMWCELPTWVRGSCSDLS